MKQETLCKHLRTKSMFVPSLAEESFQHGAEEQGHSSHCWCNCTLTPVGPDDQPVGPRLCRPGRQCFEE